MTILCGRRVGLAHSPVQQRRSYLSGGHCGQTFQNCLVPSRHKSGPAVALCPPNPTHTDAPGALETAQPGRWGRGSVGEGGRPGLLPAGHGGDLLPEAGVQERVLLPVCREPRVVLPYKGVPSGELRGRPTEGGTGVHPEARGRREG